MFRVRLTFHLPKAPSTVPTGVSGRRRRGDPGSALMVSDGHRSPWETVDGSPRRRDAGDAGGQRSAGLSAAHCSTQAPLLPGLTVLTLLHGAQRTQEGIAGGAARPRGWHHRGAALLGTPGDVISCLCPGEGLSWKALGTAPCQEHGQLLAQLLAACFHPGMPNPGKESRLAEKNTGVRAQSHSWLCHSPSPNIWSRILLSRETNLASGEQLARRLN